MGSGSPHAGGAHLVLQHVRLPVPGGVAAAAGDVDDPEHPGDWHVAIGDFERRARRSDGGRRSRFSAGGRGGPNRVGRSGRFLWLGGHRDLRRDDPPRDGGRGRNHRRLAQPAGLGKRGRDRLRGRSTGAGGHAWRVGRPLRRRGGDPEDRGVSPEHHCLFCAVPAFCHGGAFARPHRLAGDLEDGAARLAGMVLVLPPRFRDRDRGRLARVVGRSLWLARQRGGRRLPVGRRRHDLLPAFGAAGMVLFRPLGVGRRGATHG